MMMNPVYRVVCDAHHIDPLPDPAPIRRVDWLPAPSALDAPLECVEVAGCRPDILDVTAAHVTQEHLRPALAAAGVENPEQFTLGLDRERILHRRPWATSEALDATQSPPVVKVDPR